MSSSGIRFSRLFGIARWEFSWDEIKEFRPNALGRGMKIITKEESVVEISGQIRKYSSTIEILRYKRPDLFGTMRVFSSAGPDSLAGSQTFQKSSLAKNGPFFFLIPGSLILLGTLFTAQCLVAVPMAIILFLLWRFTLNTPYLLKIEENRLSTKSFRRQQGLTAQQISAITMVTSHNRWGMARNHIRIALLDGDSFMLAGFLGGDELVYGFLKNWWSKYQNA